MLAEVGLLATIFAFFAALYAIVASRTQWAQCCFVYICDAVRCHRGARDCPDNGTVPDQVCLVGDQPGHVNVLPDDRDLGLTGRIIVVLVILDECICGSGYLG